jgi:DNA ligase-1
MITRPLLAANVEVSKLQYPLLATQKIDGVRALKIDNTLLSRSWKPIPNRLLQARLTKLLPDGADGEIVVNKGNSDGDIYTTTSSVMTAAKECRFIFYWFDWVSTSPDKPYKDRVADILDYHLEVVDDMITIIALIPEVIPNKISLLDYERRVIAKGYEGVILRKPDGRYKCGRSTVYEGLLLKLKRFTDAEAIIIGFEELMHNINKVQYDPFGNIKRSNIKSMFVSGNTLGAIVASDLSSPYTNGSLGPGEGVKFKIGTGFTDALRSYIWNNRNNFLGKLVKYKYMGRSANSAPRFPVFLDIRSPYDI